MSIRNSIFGLLLLWPLLASGLQEQAPDDSTVVEDKDETGLFLDGEELTEKQVDAIKTDTQTNEDPDAKRRMDRETDISEQEKGFEWSIYGSVRLHAINAFDVETAESEGSLGDGASRAGITADWRMQNGWNLFGRLESGFDVLDTFTPKAQNDDGGVFSPRLYNIAFESDSFNAKLGKSWSVYYQVAGAADRFSIFGGSAAGVYNAGTDGGDTGTGRANDAFQSQIYLDTERWSSIRPFNLNLQVQKNQPIPRVEGRKYSSAWSASAWQQTNFGVGVGVAYHHASIDSPLDEVLRQAGIDGDARALSVAFKTTGNRWFASLVLSRLENIETTNEFFYFNGKGAELFSQWEFRDRWWMVGGANWLLPDDEQEQAKEYEIKYMVLGLRYTFDGFHRMLYAEWRYDQGTLADGTPNENEFTMGVRWDFGY
jgi:predicted porin